MNFNLKNLIPKFKSNGIYYAEDYQKVLMQMLIKSQLKQDDLYVKSCHFEIDETYCHLTELNHNFDKLPKYLTLRQKETIFMEYFIYYPFREGEEPYFGHFDININSPIHSPINNMHFASEILKYSHHDITYYKDKSLPFNKPSINISNSVTHTSISNTCLVENEFAMKVRVEFKIKRKFLRMKKDWNNRWEFVLPWNHIIK